MSQPPIGSIQILADVGGTNARFAVRGGDGKPTDIRRFAVRDFPRFPDALVEYADGRPVVSVAVAAAGPVVDGAVRLTNAGWLISEPEILGVCPDAKVHVLNDLEAVALALPMLSGSDVATLHAGEPVTRSPMLALNVGTGFGAAVAVPAGNCWTALPTEAGHMSLIPTEADRFLFSAQTTIEGVLSGPSLARLRENTQDPAALRAGFSRILGRVAGDLVLATGAWGGLFLCGGVLSEMAETVDRGVFLDALHDRRGVAARIHSVPVHQIRADEPALLGLSTLG